MKKIHFLLLTTLLIFSACNKYEDGPALSLNTKKHRVVNSWRIEQVFETPSNGSKTDKTTEYKNGYVNYNMTINENGTYTVSYRPYNVADYNESGTWIFSAGNTNLVFVDSNGNSSSIGTIWKITRLKEKELWMRTINGNNVTIEAHFVPN